MTCIIENKYKHLLGNEDEFKKEILKYKNENNKKKNENLMNETIRRIKMFKWLGSEIIFDLSLFEKCALRYYGRIILNYIYEYQNEKVLEEVYEYLYGIMETKEEKENLKNDKNFYLFKKQKIVLYQNENILKKIKNLINNSQYYFDFEKILFVIKNKNLDDTFEKIIDECIKKNKYDNMINFAFDNDLYELFIYLYVYQQIPFNYSKIVYDSNSKNNSKNDDISIVDRIKVESNSGNCDNHAIFFEESKEKMKIMERLLYLKKYSKRNGVIYQFNKKYLPIIKNNI
jgi:hypothetical protein